MAGQEEIQLPSADIVTCVQAAFILSGLKAMGILLLIAGAFAAYFKFSDRFGAAGKTPGLHRQQGGHLRHRLLDGGERAERRVGGTAPGQSRWDPLR